MLAGIEVKSGDVKYDILNWILSLLILDLAKCLKLPKEIAGHCRRIVWVCFSIFWNQVLNI